MAHRKHLLAGFAATAAVMALSSAAFACTIWKGTMTVQGDLDTAPSTTANGDRRLGMTHCVDTPMSHATASQTGSVTINVDPFAGDATCPSSKLTDGEYDVNFYDGVAFAHVGSLHVWTQDCMSPRGGAVEGIGTMTVSGGSGSGTYNISAGGPRDDAAVCVSGPGAGKNAEGNQAPVRVV